MIDPRFGLNEGRVHMVNPDIWRTLFSRNGGRSMSLNQEMNKAYDIAFGIFSHGPHEWTPLKSVALHDAENPWRQIGRQALIRQFDTYGIKEYMSLDAYLKSPFPVSNTVLNLAIEKLKQMADNQETEEEKMRRLELEASQGK